MEIVCQKCESKFVFPEERLPVGRSVTVKCATCSSKIEVAPGDPSTARSSNPGPEAGSAAKNAVSYNASERPFDYLEEGIETALLCEHDLDVRQKIHAVLDKMDYHVVEAASARNALKYMRFHTYDLVVLNEEFETSNKENNHVLQYLSQLPIATRRDSFVVLLSRSLRTMDNMAAFNRSANLIVNSGDVGDMEKILKGALNEHRAFYQVFRESMVKTGRI